MSGLKNLIKPDETPAFCTFIIKDINPLGKIAKRRLIYKPNQDMRALHERLLERLEPLGRRTLKYCHGSIKDRSQKSNALKHRYQRYFFTLDVRHAFQTLDGNKLADALLSLDPSLGPKEDVLEFLHSFCLDGKGGLITGAPASPLLYNLYLSVFADHELSRLRQQYHLTYTRFLDDLFFSATQPIGHKKRSAICRILTTAGLTLNHAKTKVWDLKKGPLVITGVTLHFGGKTSLSKSYQAKIRGILHLGLHGQVSPEKVHGLVGLFMSLTTKPYTKAEQKILEAYWKFKNSIYHQQLKRYHHPTTISG